MDCAQGMGGLFHYNMSIPLLSPIKRQVLEVPLIGAYFFCRCTYLNTHIHGDISLSLRGFLPTGFVWSQGRQGRYIRTNSTGIRRRRPGVPRGTKMAPQGRPIKRRHGAQDLPMKAKRQKRIHDLSTAIAKGRR